MSEKTRDVSVVVVADFDTVACMDGLNTFNDYLCELTSEDYLQDISWEVLGAVEGGIHLRVKGYVEDDGLDDAEDDSDHGEAEMLAGMAHGNRGLAEYGGLETDRPGGTGCYGCGGRGCENCNWGES